MSRTDPLTLSGASFPIKVEAGGEYATSSKPATIAAADEGSSFANVTHGVYLYYARALGATQLTTAFIFYIAYQVMMIHTLREIAEILFERVCFFLPRALEELLGQPPHAGPLGEQERGRTAAGGVVQEHLEPDGGDLGDGGAEVRREGDGRHRADFVGQRRHRD